MKGDLVRRVHKNLCFLTDGSRNDDGPRDRFCWSVNSTYITYLSTKGQNVS